MEEFEHRCHENMTHAMETEEGLGIEYDEDVVCDVCQSPDGEDNNEMVFCDKCNICVHQVRGHPRTDVNGTRCAPERCVSPPGLLRHSEGPKGQLALPDLRPRHPPEMPVVSQEGRRHEADPEWNQVGPRQLCLVDPRGEGQRSLSLLLPCSRLLRGRCRSREDLGNPVWLPVRRLHGTRAPLLKTKSFLFVQVSIGNPEKMEPITNVSQIPSNRWALICCLCKEKSGACIQVRGAAEPASTPGREEEGEEKAPKPRLTPLCRLFFCRSAQRKTAARPSTSPVASTPAWR